MSSPVATSTSLISGIGVGFNTFTGLQMPGALSPASSLNPNGQGLSSQFYLKVCASTASFNNAASHALGVSAQLSSGSSDSGDSSSSSAGPTVGGNLSVANSLGISDTSVSVIVYKNVITESPIYDSASLASGIAVPVTAAESQTFYQQYGDSFVAATTEGGEYMAAFVFYCQTEQDKHSVQASLSASGVVNIDTGSSSGTNVNLGATVGAGIATTVNNTNVRCSIYQSLLGANLSALNPAQALPEYSGNLEDYVSAIVNFAQGFAAADVNAPVVFDFETQGYETLFEATASPGFLAITANRDIYLQSVGPNLNALQNLSTTYAWINNAYQTYGYTGDTLLTANQKQLDSDINGLNQWLLPQWSASTLLPYNIVGGSGGMSLAAFNGSLYMAFVGTDNQINLWSSVNGVTWDNQVETGFYCVGAPALAVYNGQLCLAFTANGGGGLMANGLYACASSNGSSFSTPAVYGSNTSSSGPCLAVAGGLLYMVYTGENTQIYLSSSSNGTSFGNEIQLPSAYKSTSASINTAMAVSGNALYVAFSASFNGTPYLGIGSAAIGAVGVGTFGAPTYVSGGTVGGTVSLASFAGVLYAAWSNGGNIVLWNQSLGTATGSCSNVVTGGQPALVECNNQLGLAYTSATTGSANIHFMTMAGGVSSNPTQTPSLPSSLNPPQSLTNGTPVFTYKTPTQPAWGETGGGPFQDINVGNSANATSSSSAASTTVSGSASASADGHTSPTASGSTTSAGNVNTSGLPLPLSNLPVISSITLWGGDWMNQIQVNYTSLAGAAQFTHGETGGGESTPLSFSAGEYISNINGISGDYVNQLAISTTSGKSLTWPTNPQSSGKFQWPVPTGAVLVGFQGHSGAYLNQLQPIVIEIQPAKWVAPSLTPLPYTDLMPVGAIGVGYNTFMGSALPNSALDPAASILGSQGVQSTSFVKVCASAESLTQTLSQTSGFSVGVPGLFKVSHSKTKTQNLSINDTAVSVVVVTRVVTDSPIYKGCALAASAQAFTPSEFITDYGDSYVSSTVNGGEYVAVFVYNCQTMTESQSVQKSLSAGVSADGAQVNASLASTLSSAQSSSKVSCTCHQSVRGSSENLPVLTYQPQTDISNLVNYAAGFDAASVNAPVVLSYTTTGYETLQPADAGFQAVVQNRSTYNANVAPALNSLNAIWTQILSLAKTYNTYGYTGDPNIVFPVPPTSNSGLVVAAINGLNQWVETVTANPLQVQPLDASLNPPAALANGAPALVCQRPLDPSILWGGVVSTPYQDINVGMAIATTNTAFNTTSSNPNPITLTSLPVIGSLTLWGLDWMGQIDVTYDLPTGPSTFTHGTWNGSENFPLNLQTGEFITSITGTWGDYINQLTFGTNLGQSYTYPPNPQSTGGVATWTAAPGEVLIGFQGSCGDYLNQLQPISIQLQPSAWTPPLLLAAATQPTLAVTGLGVGYNTFLGSALPNSAITPPASVGSQNVASQNWYQVCNSSSSLDQTLGHKYGGTVKGETAKHQGSNTVKSSNTSVSVVVYANAVTQSPIYNAAVSLAPAAAGLSPTELFTAYGDSYVSAATLGAEYVAVFVYECETASQQQSVMNALAVNGVVPSDPPVSIGVNFSKNMTNASSQTNVNCRVYQMLSGSALSLPGITNDTQTDITNLVSFAQNLSVGDVAGNGVVLDFATTSYETLLTGSAATAFQPIVSNRQAYVNNVGPSLASLSTIRSQVQQVASLYTKYGYVGDSAFTANCKQVNQDTAALQTWVNQVNANPLGSYAYPNPPQSLKTGTPTAQWAVTTGPTWGSVVSGAWSDLATSSTASTNTANNSSNPSTPIPLADYPVLASIMVWGPNWVGQIGTSYQTSTGTVQFVHGSTSGGKDSVYPALNLSTGEFITSISGTSGDFVNQLTLSTNFGQKVTFPPSPQSAGAFSWQVPAGATLVGFQGTCGDYLNQLAPVYLQFQPAAWAPCPLSAQNAPASENSGSDAQYIPAGSYQASSSNITIKIQAQCTSESGSQVASSLTYTTAQATTIGDIGNINGALTIATGNGSTPNPTHKFGPYVPAGSYQNSSSGITVTISALCQNTNNQWVGSSLTYTTAQAANIQDISNNNGALTIVNT